MVLISQGEANSQFSCQVMAELAPFPCVIPSPEVPKLGKHYLTPPPAMSRQGRISIRFYELLRLPFRSAPRDQA